MRTLLDTIVISDEIPATIISLAKQERRNYKVFSLRFLGDCVHENILYQVNKKFAVETNIIFASVNELQDTALGIFIVVFIGDNEEIKKVTEHILQYSITCQEVFLP